MPPKKITQGPATTAVTDDLATATAEGMKSEVARVVEETKADGVDKGFTLYVSARPEADTFDLTCGIEEDEISRGVWDRHGEHVVFRVPNKIVDRIDRHVFVTSGRVVKAEADKKKAEATE